MKSNLGMSKPTSSPSPVGPGLGSVLPVGVAGATGSISMGRIHVMGATGPTGPAEMPVKTCWFDRTGNMRAERTEESVWALEEFGSGYLKIYLLLHSESKERLIFNLSSKELTVEDLESVMMGKCKGSFSESQTEAIRAAKTDLDRHGWTTVWPVMSR